MSGTVLRQVENLLDKLTASEQAALMERLARRIRLSLASAPGPRQDLYGAWRDKFPEQVDLESALCEIRQEWEAEWDEEGKFSE